MGTLFSIGLKVISNIVGRNIYFITLNTGSYANSFHNNRQIRNDQDYSCISCEFSLSALLYIEHLGTWVVFTIYFFY